MLRSWFVSGLGAVPGRSSQHCWDDSQNLSMSQHCYYKPKSTSFGLQHRISIQPTEKSEQRTMRKGYAKNSMTLFLTCYRDGFCRTDFGANAAAPTKSIVSCFYAPILTDFTLDSFSWVGSEHGCRTIFQAFPTFKWAYAFFLVNLNSHSVFREV